MTASVLKQDPNQIKVKLKICNGSTGEHYFMILFMRVKNALKQ